MDENELIKNLYCTAIADKKKNLKRLIPKEQSNKDKKDDKLPSLTPNPKGGNIIIQSWNTRKDMLPNPEIPRNLPIIIDPNKISMKGLKMLALPDVAEQKKKDDYL